MPSKRRKYRYHTKQHRAHLSNSFQTKDQVRVVCAVSRMDSMET